MPTVVPVLTQVDPLPRPERQTPARQRQRQCRPEQRGLDVGRHVIVALERVGPEAGPLRHGVVEPRLEVPANIRGGVLIERQRGRGVLDHEVEEADADLIQTLDSVEDLARDQVKTPRTRGERDPALDPEHPPRICKALISHGRSPAFPGKAGARPYD